MLPRDLDLIAEGILTEEELVILARYVVLRQDEYYVPTGNPYREKMYDIAHRIGIPPIVLFDNTAIGVAFARYIVAQADAKLEEEACGTQS